MTHQICRHRRCRRRPRHIKKEKTFKSTWLFKFLIIIFRDVTIIRDRSLDRSKVRDRSIDRKETISQSITSFFLILKSNNDFFLIYLFIIYIIILFLSFDNKSLLVSSKMKVIYKIKLLIRKVYGIFNF